MSRGAVRTVDRPATNGNGRPKPGPRPAKARRSSPVIVEEKISSGDKHLEWVPVANMRISEVAQRSHDSASSRAKIADIAAHFDPDKFGTLTVNFRDGVYWVIDGGHRYLSLVELDWEDQLIQAWVYTGLSEAEEADKFLALNDVKPVSGMDKFKQALVAGPDRHPVECEIARIVRSLDLKVGQGRDAISCVGVLMSLYTEHSPRILATTLRIIRDSFGSVGFSSRMIAGVGMFVSRYGDKLNEDVVIQRLSTKRGGVAALLGEAERIKIKYDVSLAEAIAVSVAETHNRGRSGPRLSSWWSEN